MYSVATGFEGGAQNAHRAAPERVGLLKISHPLDTSKYCFIWLKSSADVTEADPGAIDVPHAQLSAEALRGVIESFVLREGTDYGEHEYSLEEKVGHVMRQLQRGEARIVFDPHTESIQILMRRDAPDGPDGPDALTRKSPR